MNGYEFELAGAALTALPSGALWWPAQALLCVSDLHLGKSERFARRGGALLPPYEVAATLDRLEALVDRLSPRAVVCLGDSFDDRAAAEALAEGPRLRIARMQAGRDWIWIEGNHDPGPTGMAGRHLGALMVGGLTFRHIAGEGPDVSGHYHPKARLAAGPARPAFLVDRRRVILPAFGAYTGGLSCTDPALAGLVSDGALAVLTGPAAVPVPLGALAARRRPGPGGPGRPRLVRR